MAEFSSLNGFMVKDTTARNIAKGRNQAVAFSDYATMIETLNATEKDEYRMGQNFYVGVVGVPDLWVYSVEDIVHNFNYISDEDVVEKLTNNTTIQAGYYKLAMLEGQKVDLTTYDAKLTEHTEDIKELNADFDAMKKSFQAGVDTLYDKCVSLGVTPTAKTPTAIATAMQSIYTNRYNEGVAYADGRVNTNSASYKAGYNAGDKTHKVESKIYYTNGGGGDVHVWPCLYVDGKLKVTGTQQNIYNMSDGNYYGSASATV